VNKRERATHIVAREQCKVSGGLLKCARSDKKKEGYEGTSCTNVEKRIKVGGHRRLKGKSHRVEAAETRFPLYGWEGGESREGSHAKQEEKLKLHEEQLRENRNASC